MSLAETTTDAKGPHDRAGEGPLATDLARARELAGWLVRAGQGRVRRVVLIGSRAQGRPTARSDFDLVVLVENASPDRPWDGDLVDAERDRLLAAIGPVSVPLDVTVRTIDQYEEARTTFGGVEQLVDREGIVLVEQPLLRAPTPRRAPDVVRRALTLAWLDGACRSISLATPPRVTRIVGAGAPVAAVASLEPDAYLHRARQQAIAALCTLHQCESAKRDNLGEVVRRLRTLHPQLPETLHAYAEAPRTIGAAVGLTVTALDVVASAFGDLPPLVEMLAFVRTRGAGTTGSLPGSLV
jgi:hypothetical protein